MVEGHDDGSENSWPCMLVSQTFTPAALPSSASPWARRKAHRSVDRGLARRSLKAVSEGSLHRTLVHPVKPLTSLPLLPTTTATTTTLTPNPRPSRRDASVGSQTIPGPGLLERAHPRLRPSALCLSHSANQSNAAHPRQAYAG